jgi:chemotaxis protein methyltransferase CheR
LCRNVLIYFNNVLQERVLNLLDSSLSLGGYLCLGNKETIDFSSLKKRYQVISDSQKIYRKMTHAEHYGFSSKKTH